MELKAEMRTRRRPLLAAVLAVAAAGLAVTLAVPGTAFALFSNTPAATTASTTAATLSAPTGFTAAVASGTTATLSWTAPSNLTGYTLRQSTGTLAGCSATPSSATTTCTATGLSPNTKYTWTLAAAYNSWKSSTVTASATTPKFA